MKIKQLLLQSNRLPELTAFYGRVLELPVEESAGFVSVTIGYSQLEFHQGSIDARYHFAFNIPFNKIDEARQWLEGRTPLMWLDDYQSNIAEFTNWRARSLYFFDPAGNVVELIGRADLKDAPAGVFSGAMIRNISEAGIVLPDDGFDTAVTELMREYQLHYFDKQAPLPQFRAIGDDEGLLVCVPQGRTWYPTRDAHAMRDPLQLNFSVNGKSCELKL